MTGCVTCILLSKVGVLVYSIHDNERGKVSIPLTPDPSNSLDGFQSVDYFYLYP